MARRTCSSCRMSKSIESQRPILTELILYRDNSCNTDQLINQRLDPLTAFFRFVRICQATCANLGDYSYA